MFSECKCIQYVSGRRDRDFGREAKRGKGKGGQRRIAWKEEIQMTGKEAESE